MSVCWKPEWCECPACGPLEEARQCRLCGEWIVLSRWHRRGPGRPVNTVTGEEVPVLAIVEWHEGCRGGVA